MTVINLWDYFSMLWEYFFFSGKLIFAANRKAISLDCSVISVSAIIWGVDDNDLSGWISSDA